VGTNGRSNIAPEGLFGKILPNAPCCPFGSIAMSVVHMVMGGISKTQFTQGIPASNSPIYVLALLVIVYVILLFPTLGVSAWQAEKLPLFT
jgi:hypothetical protein